jgi:hypothetical protein
VRDLGVPSGGAPCERSGRWRRTIGRFVAGVLLCGSGGGLVVGLSAVVASPNAAAAEPSDPTISCASDPNLFNTGYDAATGGVLPDSTSSSPSLDANWQVAGPFYASTNGTSPADGVLPPPANATWTLANVGPVAGSAYSSTPFSNAQWISQQIESSPNQGTGSDNADWYYQYDFSLAASVIPSSFSLAMNFMSDNDVAGIFVNGTQVTATGIPQNPGCGVARSRTRDRRFTPTGSSSTSPTRPRLSLRRR